MNRRTMTRQGKLSINDLGCYADGCFGSDYASRKLADIATEFDAPENIINGLLATDSEDDMLSLDGQDEALEWLNDNVCDYPAQFVFSNGDLMLVNVEEWEE